jgi:hypothetical protein
MGEEYGDGSQDGGGDSLGNMGKGSMGMGVGNMGVTILTGKTLDSAVMTTRAEKYH